MEKTSGWVFQAWLSNDAKIYAEQNFDAICECVEKQIVDPAVAPLSQLNPKLGISVVPEDAVDRHPNFLVRVSQSCNEFRQAVAAGVECQVVSVPAHQAEDGHQIPESLQVFDRSQITFLDEA